MGRHSPKPKAEEGIDNFLLFFAGVTLGVFGTAVSYSYHPHLADVSSRIIIGATVAISAIVIIALVSIQILRRRKD